MRSAENLVHEIVVSVDPGQAEWIALFMKATPRVRIAMMRNKMGFDPKYYRGKADRDHLATFNDFKREDELGRRMDQVKQECEKLMLYHEQ